MSEEDYGSSYTVTSTTVQESYYYTNPDGSTYHGNTKGGSTYQPPPELLDSDHEGEESETLSRELRTGHGSISYDDQDRERASGNVIAQQAIGSSPAYYVEEQRPDQIVQLEQGARGQLDDVQYSPEHEEVVSDDDGHGYGDVEEEETGNGYGEDY